MEGHVDTIGQVLRLAAATHGARDYVQCDGRRVTFVQADAIVDDLALALLAQGVSRGSRVAMLLSNSLEFPLYLLACARIGAISIPLGTRYTGVELADLLRRSRAELLVSQPDLADRLVAAVEDLKLTGEIHPGGKALPDLARIVLVSDTSEAFVPPVGARASRAALAEVVAEVSSADSAIVVYTSGTSGVPKGAVLTHGMLRNCRNMVRAFGITAADRILGHMPFYHVAGLCAALLPPLLTGASVVVVGKWDADAVASLIADQGVTMFGGIPTHYIDLLDAIARSGRQITTLRTAWIGGATISPELAERALAELRLGGLQAIYGMTETTSTTTLTPIGDDLARVCENKGKPIGDFEIGIFDAQSDALRGAGESGEIRVRGYLVMQGYLDDPQATAEAITPDGWFRTGDLGAFDAAGYLQIQGRLKDVFRVGGSTVSPAEVETVLTAIKGVRQAVVVGVSDQRLGEVGFAFIQAEHPGSVSQSTIDAALRSKLAGYKRPQFFRFVESFPMTSTGKLQREALRRTGEMEARSCAA